MWLKINKFFRYNWWFFCYRDRPENLNKEELSNATFGTFGDNFKHNFAETNDFDYDMWWDWTYRNLWTYDFQSFSNKRSDVIKGIPESSKFHNVKSLQDLKDACNEAYSKTPSDINSDLLYMHKLYGGIAP